MEFFKKRVLKRGTRDYLIRYTLFKCKFFSVKIHKALMSDPAILHDHPWSYASLILKNGYYEHTQDGKRFYGVGSLLFRDGSIPHKLEVVEGKPSLSLIVTTKPWRQWGFQSKEGWKPFTEVEY